MKKKLQNDETTRKNENMTKRKHEDTIIQQ